MRARCWHAYIPYQHSTVHPVTAIRYSRPNNIYISSSPSLNGPGLVEAGDDTGPAGALQGRLHDDSKWRKIGRRKTLSWVSF